MKEKSELHFPMVIAITALILSLISGVVNYRQNNLSNLESSLRDTRDQLQLAKSDIADIKMQTVQKLVDAELAYKAQERLEDEKNILRLDLSDARDRIAELETQVKNLDRSLAKRKRPAKESRKKSTTKASMDKTINIGSKSIPDPVRSKASAVTAAKPESADLDIYTVKISNSLQQQIAKTIVKKGFASNFPVKSESMSMTSTTTVFYYDESYMMVAKTLADELAHMSGSKVILRKGASAFSKNKIIAHIIGD